jgi:DNA-directed RNA polymerase subunit N (RpoN/RPB10)
VRTLMIRRGRLLLAIGSGPGRGLPPLRSCGAADALRIARWWRRRKQAVEGGERGERRVGALGARYCTRTRLFAVVVSLPGRAACRWVH